jgi:putative ABC transport system substrate-binding protein
MSSSDGAVAGATRVRSTIARFTLLALLLLALAPTAGAQPSRKVRIGYLSGNPSSDTRDALAGFITKLRELGYVEGNNLLIDVRYADGRYDRLPDLAADLVRLKVDVIFSYGTPGSLAAKNTTNTIPIVFGGVADPLGVGLVATVTRPGANVTGVMSNNPELGAKRLSLLKEAIPGLSRVAVLANPDFKPTASMVTETKLGARSLGVEVQVVEARTPQEIANAFGVISTAKVNALAVLVDPMFIAERQRIAELAMKNRIPAIYHLRQFVEAGGLISYGVDYVEAFQQSAVLVDKILKGAKPADLPVEQPWRFALVINLKTASALGLTIPSSLLLRADQIIQ